MKELKFGINSNQIALLCIDSNLSRYSEVRKRCALKRSIVKRDDNTKFIKNKSNTVVWSVR